MDTTLRDGEQTSGVSFSASEKLTIAQLLLTELKVDRIEIASARVSEGEFQAVKKMTGPGLMAILIKLKYSHLWMVILPLTGCCNPEQG